MSDTKAGAAVETPAEKDAAEALAKERLKTLAAAKEAERAKRKDAKNRAKREARAAEKKPRGGAREGAGARPASEFYLSPKQLAALSREIDPFRDDLSPLDMLQIGSRIMFKAAVKRGGRVGRADLRAAMEYAKMAAPYLHAHLVAGVAAWRTPGAGPSPAVVPVPAGPVGRQPLDNGRRVVSIAEAAARGVKAA